MNDYRLSNLLRRCAISAALVVVAFLVLGGAFAQGRGATHIAFKRWQVETRSGIEKTLPRGKRFEHCASDPVTQMFAAGLARNAKAGVRKVERWFVDGKLFHAFHLHWATSGSGSYSSYGLSTSRPHGLRDGIWKVEQRQKGRKIGSAKIRLVSDSSC